MPRGSPRSPPPSARSSRPCARPQIGQRDRLIRLGLDSEAEIVFAIVRENRDDAGNVTYVQGAREHERLERAMVEIEIGVISAAC